MSGAWCEHTGGKCAGRGEPVPSERCGRQPGQTDGREANVLTLELCSFGSWRVIATGLQEKVKEQRRGYEQHTRERGCSSTTPLLQFGKIFIHRKSVQKGLVTANPGRGPGQGGEEEVNCSIQKQPQNPKQERDWKGSYKRAGRVGKRKGQEKSSGKLSAHRR